VCVFFFYIYILGTLYKGSCMKAKAYWSSACCSITLSNAFIGPLSLSLSLSLSSARNCTDMAPNKLGFFYA
jgi:hypothetical protein